MEDDTVPPGWKSRTAEGKVGKQFFLSPGGTQFATRFVAYRHLVAQRFPAADQLEMRRCLTKHENWAESSLLPAGWNFKEDNFLTRGNQQPTQQTVS